jgi:hypothetical protein
MVSPITSESVGAGHGLPLQFELFSTSKAAAVELSTPPLIAMATVMGIESLIH